MSDEATPVEVLPDAEHLLTLLAVADAGNESAAAEILGVGQSSINRRLSGLQQHSALPLTKRTAAGTRVTPAGAALLPYARDVREALRSAARLLAPAGSAPLRLNLGLSPHLLPRLSGALAGAAQADEPLDISFSEASSSDLLGAVRANTLDAAVTLWAPAGTEPGLRAEKIGTDRVVLVAPAGSKVVAKNQINLAELRASTVLLPGRSTIADRGRAFARVLGISQTQVTQLSGPAAVRAAVLAGQGVGVTLASYVASETSAAWLSAAPLSSVGDSAAPNDVAEPTGGPAEKAAGLDAVSLWLLINDSAPEAASQRLLSLLSSAASS